MKSKTIGKKAFLLSTVFILASANSYSNDFDSQEYSSDIPIDIEGSFERKTEADRIEKLRQKLEKQNEDFVQKKIEDLRYENEKKMSDTLSDAFSGRMNTSTNDLPAEDRKSNAVSEVKEVEKDKTNFSVTPQYNFSNYSGNGFDLESDLGFSLGLEGHVYKNVSLGLNIGYESISAMDISNYYGYPYSYGNLFRNLNVSLLTAEVMSKVYFGNNDRFKPFIGAGVSVARANLSFDESNIYDSYYFGGIEGLSEETKTYFNGILRAGAMINFSSTVGLLVEGSYAQGFSGVSGGNVALTNDQYSLQNFGSALSESSKIGLSAGLTINF